MGILDTIKKMFGGSEAPAEEVQAEEAAPTEEVQAEETTTEEQPMQ
jgi:hypothetical protein